MGDQLSFEKTIVGVSHNPKDHAFNFIFSDGTRTNQPTGGLKMQEDRFDPSQVRKIVIYHYNNFLNGLKLSDKSNNLILEAGPCSGTDTIILIEKNERIVGVKARDSSYNWTYFQFVIGKVE